MLFYLTFRLISSVSAFLYPGYASFKTLSQRPASEEELERWLMYWSVLGCIVGVEYVAEWLISWLPFYYPIKTLFLLYLALPQTQGSSYLYLHHIKPFFTEHETQIDAGIASLKTRVYAFAQEKLRMLWNHVTNAVGQGDLTSVGRVSQEADINAGAPPTLSDPVSGPVQMATSFWRSYGPGILATGAAFMKQSSAATTSASNRALNSPPLRPSMAPSQSTESTSQSVLERRRQLEAELASLPPVQMPVPEVPMPAYAPPSRGSSDSDLRERTVSGGRFEEVEVPSDYEGEQGHAYPRPPVQKRNSWFFGWGGAGEGQGYERVKTD
ncbi:hypothetical protein GLOTRDRAFT_65359 [Gloeophyllum trabeum ATCC 11539]|uniref:Protein YOP1 n=1 Tax=Gloeophyllum trabeum (strain ATCC 11539 / FP-39264 / Madison 617) TaxID=670483 RepID=S7PVW2_GLOTA|nr:uncharacterized protein GLOTRDRAFT_65359 [Gloeophyllum trabeum ATCC 11539]EPQ51771.1 hypothetical protein GLOTRDRAFT_65359 [Gloeophyllum trabeum ATCC 11539]